MVVQMRDLLARHPDVNIIWAHAGLGRVVHPVKDQLSFMLRGLANPALKGFYIDISWDEMAKYVVASPETIAGGGRRDQPVPRSLAVRHRRGGADRPGRSTSRSTTSTRRCSRS